MAGQDRGRGRRGRGLWAALILACAPAPDAPAASAPVSVEAAADGATVTLDLPARVEWRVFVLDAPPRVVLDLRGAAPGTGPAPAVLPAAGPVAALRFGLFRPGWARLVVDLSAPARVAEAGFEEGSRFRLRLAAATAAEFASLAGAPPEALWDLGAAPAPALAPPPARRGPGEPLVIAIDPGHGGVDPGAVRDELTEKAIALDLSRVIAARLAASGRYVPVLTRTEDVFLPLRERVRIAQVAGADAFLSIHVNTEETGTAEGISVFSLSEAASDRAAAALAELENRADAFAGLDAFDGEAEVTRVLLDLAQRETNHRSRRLAAAFLARLTEAESLIRSNPHRAAGFLVLRAPDVPSLLLELGFLSSDADRARLTDPAWAERMAGDVLAALDAWVAEEAARPALARP